MGRRTGLSPFFLMTGQDMNLGKDIELGMADGPKGKTPAAVRKGLTKKTVMGFKIAREHILQEQQRQRTYYDSGRKGMELKVGDEVTEVMYYRPKVRVRAGQMKKLCRVWHGPYRITELTGPGLLKRKATPQAGEFCDLHREKRKSYILWSQATKKILSKNKITEDEKKSKKE